MSNIINYTRLTASEKQSDRFVTCQVYQPLDIEQRELGSVYSHVEILNPWFPNSQIGQTVINTLIREYYRGSNTSELVNFENAVKKVNETLAQIAQSGETDWIGKTNGVLMLINEKELHLAQTGTSQAYLYRGNKINHITEGLGTQEKPHPLKTFSNLISGTLQEGDKIVVANNAFYEIISASELKNIINSFPPAIAAIESAKILRKNNGANSNAMFFELTTKEELANLPKEQKVDTVYLDQASFNPMSSVSAMFTSLFIPQAKKLLSSSAKMLSSGKSKLSPKIKESFRVTGAWTKKRVTSLKRPPVSEPAYEEAPISEEAGAYTIKRNSAPILNKLKTRFKKFFVRFGFLPKLNNKLILRIALVLICISLISIATALITRSGNKKSKAINAKSQEINTNYQNALDNLSNNSQVSMQLFESIISSSKELEGTKFASDAQAKAKLSQDNIDQLTKTTTLSAISSSPLEGVATSGYFKEKIISIDKNGDIFSKLPTLKDFTKVGSLKIKATNPDVIYLSDSSQIAISNSDKQIEIFKGSEFSLGIVSSIVDSGPAKEYLGYIYVVNQKDNHIYKYSVDNGRLDQPSDYLKEGTSVANSVDLAIDGSVFTLERNAKVRRLSRGKVINEMQVVLPQGQSFKNPTRLFTDENSDSIFVVDARDSLKVVEISKDGQFKSQFNLDGTDSSSKISINASARSAVCATKDGVSEYKF